MDETIGQNVRLSDSDFNLCVLWLPYNLAGCEPLRYMFSYCSLLKKPFLFKVHKNLWKFPSLPISVLDKCYFQTSIIITKSTEMIWQQIDVNITFCEFLEKLLFSSFTCLKTSEVFCYCFQVITWPYFLFVDSQNILSFLSTL